MTSSPVSRGSGAESNEQTRTPGGGDSSSSVLGKVRQTLTSSGFAGLTGGLMVLRGLRAVRRGKRLRGIARIVAGGLLLATVYRQRRQSGAGQRSRDAGVDQEDVVDTSPDVGHVDDAGLDREEHASGEAARDVAESSVDVEDVTDDEATEERATDESASSEEGTEGAGERRGEEPSEVEIDFAADVDEPQEGIGAGTFDARRGVPVPEPAFEEGFLELGEDVFWAIREADDAVFVSRHRAVFEDSEGVEYVTSSEVDDEQTLSVPDVILDHWEGVDDAEPVSDADELVFATTDDLRWVDVLWIVTEHRTGEFDEL